MHELALERPALDSGSRIISKNLPTQASQGVFEVKKLYYLTPTETQDLGGIALGFMRREIAELTGRSPHTVHAILARVFHTLDAQNGVEACLKGVAVGALNLEALVEEKEIARVAKISLKEREVMDQMIYCYGRYSTNNLIAERLGRSPLTISNHVASILTRLETPTRERAAVVYLASRSVSIKPALVAV